MSPAAQPRSSHPPIGARHRRHGTITKEEALSQIRRWQEKYPNIAPEVTAIWLFRRQIDSWDEHRAVLNALDEVLAQDTHNEGN